MRSKRNTWTIEKSMEEAKKYKTKNEFKKGSNRAYTVLCKNKMLDEACIHMTTPKHWLFWTKDRCIEAAKQCQFKSEFMKKFCGAYNSAKKHGWFDELIQYFTPLGSKYNRCIYVCEFEDRSVYVGLTYNFNERKKQHLRNNDSSVYRYMDDTGLKPIFKQITDYIDYKEASIREGEILEEYINKGFNILNKTQTGGLGSKDTVIARKWTREKIFEVVQTCNSYQTFCKQFRGAENAARKYGYIDEIKKILPPHHNVKCKKWTIETAIEESKKYKTIKDFSKNSSSAYNFLLKHKLSIEIRKGKILLQRDAWSFDEAHKEALKYDNKKDFRKNKPGCYSVCTQRGWLNEVCSHMRDLNKERIIYTESFVINILKDFEFMGQLKKSENKTIRGCYWWMKKHKKLIEYKKYLKETDIVTLWTDEKAYKELKKYDSYSEFRANSNSCYQYFVRHKKLKEIKEYYEKINL